MGINVRPLLQLIDGGLCSELASYGVGTTNSSEFGQILASIEAEQRRAAHVEAAEQILSLLKMNDEIIESTVIQIREARRETAAKEAFLKRLHRAGVYGRKTNNFLPLLVLISPATVMHLQVENQSLLRVPDDFKIDEAPPKRHVAKKAAKAVRVR